MNNYIIKTLAYNKQVRILWIDNTDMIKEICDNKNMNKLLKNILGKTVSIAGLISGTLKGNQRVSIKISASERKYKIFTDVDSMGNVRGYINDELLNVPLNEINKLSIEEIIGDKGCIQVLKDLGMNSIFTGITGMPYGNIVDDFSYYFNQSEQIPSFFHVNMIYNENNEIELSRGIMVQLLPGAPSNIIDDIKKVIVENQHIISRNDKELDEISCLLFEDIEILEKSTINFFCGCSKDVFYPMLHSLNREELVDAYENNKSIEMVCNICGEKYVFEKDDIGKLI
ncbi:Hsp33 family molecular chaperone HslO [Clostridium sp. 'White wine YQ']|uniref:Hsp33 family molecular chaperone HslO n=1 Tax=Clostridium sp. 'White wine YQ' TaxID=3027474 RepID=UPI002366DD19|nr:Hsp33 family molecular chaperone HslO [Clostridium sp. 'White wine YQ']MDD7795509.1 Hsp33 family molecular chaperone HslO [Clostridium sp. 'White wine YQ']